MMMEQEFIRVDAPNNTGHTLNLSHKRFAKIDDMRFITIFVFMAATISACGSGGPGASSNSSNSNNQTTNLVWDNDNWDDKNWE